jgi:peptide/nickel transport system ATP-binding protein
LLITHDMGVVADMADRIAVMYAGRAVEEGAVYSLFGRQHHPYTKLLLQSLPSVETKRRAQLSAIDGAVPDFRSWPSGCRFHPRCPLADAVCSATAPPLAPIANTGQTAACWHHDRVAELTP